MPFYYPQDGIDDVQSAHLTQILDAWLGVSGKGVPLSAISVSDAVNFAISARNLDVTNSRVAQFLKSDGTVLFQADASGVKISPDGVSAGIPVTTVSPQTLTNKTFTNPTINGALTGTAGFGAPTSWSPALTQAGTTPTVTNLRSTYNVIGKEVFLEADITAGSAGSAGSPIIISSLPIPPARNSAYNASGTFLALVGGLFRVGVCVVVSNTNVQLMCNGAANYLGADPNVAIAANDVFSLNMRYVAA